MTSMSHSSSSIPMSRRLYRLANRLNRFSILLLAGLIFLMVNILSARFYHRGHWNRVPQGRLSSRTLQILDSVQEDLQISVLLRPTHEAYSRTATLLREYAAASDKVALQWIDPDRQLAEAEQAVRRYRLTEGEAVVFDLGGRHQSVSANNLVEYGYPGDAARSPIRAFRGEPLFSSTIYALAHALRPTVFFVQGHGERSPLDYDRRSGYSRVAARLREANLEVDILNLGEAKSVPAHCALMILAGPVRELAPFEVALVRDYLDRKGRLLALLDARITSGLEPVLQNWGVLLGDDIVVDDSRTLTGRELYTTVYDDHPITRPLQGMASVLYLPRAVRPTPVSRGGDKPVLSPLISCSANGWAELNPDDASPQLDPAVDIAGPVPVALAIERGPVPGVHVQIRPTRLVVVGDSTFISNGGLMGANLDFFLNAVHWLLEREDMLAISPVVMDDFRVVMNARQLHMLFAAVVAGLPSLVALMGLLVAWRRRH